MLIFLAQILHLLLTLYCCIVFLRYAAQLHGVDFRNPLSKALMQITNPPIVPLRRIIPGWKGQDIATLALLGLLIVIELIFASLLFGSQLNPFGLILTLAYRLTSIVLTTYFFALIFSAIMSWINSDPYHPARDFFTPITRPVLKPLQKYIKPLAGSIDITPMIALLIIYILKQFLAQLFITLNNNLWSLTQGDQHLIRFMLN